MLPRETEADRGVKAARGDQPDERGEVGPRRLGVRVGKVANQTGPLVAAVDVETRDRRLTTLSEALALDPLPVDQSVAEAWARLRVLLRDMQKRMPVNDSWIAATAMSLGVPVVTQDEDYVEVPGLEIIRV